MFSERISDKYINIIEIIDKRESKVIERIDQLENNLKELKKTCEEQKILREKIEPSPSDLVVSENINTCSAMLYCILGVFLYIWSILSRILSIRIPGLIMDVGQLTFYIFSCASLYSYVHSH